MGGLKFLCFVASLLCYCECANILYVIPFTSKSHYIMLRPLGLELARRGHNVTVITAFKETNHAPTYHQVIADDKKIWDVSEGGRPNIFKMVELSDEKFHEKILWHGGLAATEVALNSSMVKDFLKKDHKFDLVISEQFYQEAMYMLAHKYNAPLALITTFGNCMRHNIIVRNPLQLSTVISEFLVIDDPNSFMGRLRNFYFVIYEYIFWRYSYIEKHEQLVKKYITNLPEPVPSLVDLEKNASLILMNGHFSFDTPTAYLPNMVEIGGIHLTETFDVLPKDLQKILDDSTNGVIYMNFGSNVRSSELPDDKKNAFINVFKRLKYTVLWKWEDENMAGKPNNLILRKWLPQKEILSHKNVKVFISHGGLIGTQEAIFHGVPIIGIPIYCDQYNNLLQAQDAGMGRVLKYNDVNEQTFENALREVLENDTYKINAKELSARFKDRPLSALDTAMFWIEYIIRNKGANYMKNPANRLSWIEYHMLDIYAFIASILAVLLYVIFKLVSFVKGLLSVKGKEDKSKTKKKRN